MGFCLLRLEHHASGLRIYAMRFALCVMLVCERWGRIRLLERKISERIEQRPLELP
jgi:hypothetical protein